MGQGISVNQLKKGYKTLMEMVAAEIESVKGTDHENHDRINCYVCPDCKTIIKTINVDRGSTPQRIACIKCGAMARSNWFRDMLPDSEPELEFYRPTLAQLMKKRGKSEDLIDYILQGGLASRPVKKPREKTKE